jgi:hypothetical protein
LLAGGQADPCTIALGDFSADTPVQLEHSLDAEATLPLLHRVARSDVIGAQTAVCVLTAMWQNHSETLPLLHEVAVSGKISAEIAVFALADTYPNHPGTLGLLCDVAASGKTGADAAIAAMLQLDHLSVTLDLLRQVAVSGKIGAETAIALLFIKWKDHPGTLPLIVGVAASRKTGAVTALRVLAGMNRRGHHFSFAGFYFGTVPVLTFRGILSITHMQRVLE